MKRDSVFRHYRVRRYSCGLRRAAARQHAVVHCKCASRVISAAMHSLCASCASFTRTADLAAYRVTSTRRLKLNNSFSRAGHADVQRVVDGEVDLRRTSTSELACDAGTSGTLSRHLAQAI